ncbi:1-phosphatidylinositol-4-phosphate 3-kinase [Aureococcus anophagefferens]|uniref:1-phosphatidylinositol-4-phosphate 3-kinase n=1 Tax=Aureococcus anophagefferens TaxID=44056 RepID=A0ABR1FVK6_AURAN
MGQGGSQPLRYKGSPSPGAVAHSRSLDSVADAGDDDPAFVSARGYDSFVDALDGSPEPAVPCAEGDAEEPPAKPSFAFSGADLFRSLRRGVVRCLRWAGRAVLCRQIVASSRLRRSLYGDEIPRGAFVARCAPQALCDALPALLALVAGAPHWLRGLRRELLAAVAARCAAHRCVGQAVHFLKQAAWCDGSVFAELDALVAAAAEGRTPHIFLSEEHWESIAATLLGSPAGFTLQLPKKVRVFDPFLPSTSISYIRVEKVFPSNTRPLLLSLHGARHRASPPSRLIYKAGDDLRQDVGVLQAFGAMNYAFEVSNTTTRDGSRVFIGTYGVCAMSGRVGCIELVRGVRALTAVCASDRFSDAQLERLVASAAGSYVGAHVLGVRDRHSDNILLADDGTLFHIDFGHVLDDSVAIDTASFATTPALRQAMGDDVWAKFVDACAAAFLALRAHADLVVSTAAAVLASAAKDGAPAVAACVRKFLLVDLDDAAATAKIRKLVDGGPAAAKTRLKNAIHALAVRRLQVATTLKHRPPPALAVGSLWKRGEGAAAGWRRRSVALIPGDAGSGTSAPKLYYFASDKDWHAFRDEGTHTQKGVIFLENVSSVRRVVVAAPSFRGARDPPSVDVPGLGAVEPSFWRGRGPASADAPGLGADAPTRRTRRAAPPRRERRASEDGARASGDKAAYDALPVLEVRARSTSGGSSLFRVSSASPRSAACASSTLRLALVTDMRTWHLRFEAPRELHRWAKLLASYADLAAGDDGDVDDAPARSMVRAETFSA